jgi:hypothetical protein
VPRAAFVPNVPGAIIPGGRSAAPGYFGAHHPREAPAGAVQSSFDLGQLGLESVALGTFEGLDQAPEATREVV